MVAYLPRKVLLKLLLQLKEDYLKLEKENQRLQSEIDRYKLQQVNKTVNQPTSKQPEWEAKGVGNDGKGKQRGRGKKGRKGSGNQPKNLKPTRKEIDPVDQCCYCGADLSDTAVLKSNNTRTIIDIPRIPVEPEVILVEQQKKYCHHCQKIVTARSTSALPGCDIGLNTTVTIIYYWIASGLSLPRISACLKDFFSVNLSTAGLSAHLIKVSKLLTPVYEQILEEVKSSRIVHGDETGWRVLGSNWWLWVFGNDHSAYYTINQSRGKDVVQSILGEIFTGVLVVDGWRAYLSVVCEKQSCMAHLLRKIRKFYAAFPHLQGLCSFYKKLRRILKDGQKLQEEHDSLGDEVFNRRLKRLNVRLNELLEWPEPDEILKEVIKKVKLQRPRILTFVEHPGVPCHNNFAEYLIRKGVLKRKISFGSKSEAGAKAYAILLSIHTTCQLRNIPFLDFINKCLLHYIKTGTPMMISQYQKKYQNVPVAA